MARKDISNYKLASSTHLKLKFTVHFLKSPKQTSIVSIPTFWETFSTFRDTDSLLESTLIVAPTVDYSNLGPSIANTLVWTFSLAFSYFVKASDLWPVLSRISFLSTPALHKLDPHITRKQCAVFHFIPAASHISANNRLSVLIPTGNLSKHILFALGPK